jgi:hypothetical protein
MVTGDGIQTAVSFARSANLLDGDIFYLTGNKKTKILERLSAARTLQLR